jgi:rhamnogalacturonyl hydrolase YesR
MRTCLTALAVIVTAATSALAEDAPAALGKPLDAAQIVGAMKRAADWQLAHPNGTDLRSWPIAPFYDGLIDLSETTGDPKYLAAVVGFGAQSGWNPGPAIYFADDHAVGHAWLDIYLLEPSKTERLKPFKERFDAILAKPIAEKLSMNRKPGTSGIQRMDRWTWCDALFMAPPTWALLARATGDRRYLEFMDSEYKATYDALWDVEEGLFFRDATFIGKKSAGGKKVFWARGNGWVFGGLPLILEVMPEDWPTRNFYVTLFKEMAPAVAATQQADGLWRPSLLDPREIATGETSGSALLLYGLAWGVNHGLIEREKYWPAIEKGWNAIAARIRPDGLVGFVQPIGVAPGKVRAGSTQLYGAGAVLMAGAEILRALGAAKTIRPAALLAQAEKLLSEGRVKPHAHGRPVQPKQ